MNGDTPSRGPRNRLKKGDGGVPVSALLRELQADGREDPVSRCMFGHENPGCGEDATPCDLFAGLSHHVLAVRGIHKDEVEDLSLLPQDRYPLLGCQGEDPRPRLQPEVLQIILEHREGALSLLHKDRLLSPAAEGLDAQRAGAGEQIENPPKDPYGTQDIEDRLADPVRGGPDQPPPGDRKLPPLELTPDDPHDPSFCNRSTTLVICP